MPISNDLFMAILAMDSYNRGYDTGLNVTGDQIGTATLSIAKGDQAAQAVGFFAQQVARMSAAKSGILWAGGQIPAQSHFGWHVFFHGDACRSSFERTRRPY